MVLTWDPAYHGEPPRQNPPPSRWDVVHEQVVARALSAPPRPTGRWRLAIGLGVLGVILAATVLMLRG